MVNWDSSSVQSEAGPTTLSYGKTISVSALFKY